MYKRMATILERFSIKKMFACRWDAKNEVGENVEVRGKQMETLCEDYFNGCRWLIGRYKCDTIFGKVFSAGGKG